MSDRENLLSSGFLSLFLCVIVCVCAGRGRVDEGFDDHMCLEFEFLESARHHSFHYYSAGCLFVLGVDCGDSAGGVNDV